VLSYALASTRTTLGGDGVTEEEDGGFTRFSVGKEPFATLAVEGNDLVVTFRKPKDLDSRLQSKLAYYEELSKPRGWLEWRTPISRDPRPELEADFGSMIGRTLFELLRKQKKR
jgi:hypothetical protein